MRLPIRRDLVALAALTSCTLPAAAQDAVTTLDRIQVTATRSPRAMQEVPASISVVEGDDYRTDSLGVNVSEKLAGVPGLLARTRNNYAQDEQLSIRGFGTRASFGIRGLRLYVDGVPATMPDGQGQVSHFPLADAQRIEVLRGPFSALYGNAAGGVIQLFTRDGTAPREWNATATAGSYGGRRASAGVADARDALGYSVGLNHFATDGYREHSRAERTLLDGKLRVAWDDTELSLLANALWAPNAQDPLGLDLAQFHDDPRQAVAGAHLFDTRKSVTQRQMGAVLTRTGATTGQWRLLAYGGARDVEQFLAIPVATQANPLSGGGVIDLHAPYYGADARWTGGAALGDGVLEIVIGLAYDRQQQDRRGYENFADGQLGVRGALRLRQDDRVAAFDQYAQATWTAAAWSLMAGVRHSQVEFRSRDHYITGANPDDSGAVRHGATSPVLALGWRPSATWHLYGSYGHGFETPTFNELGYRADGGSGLNFALQPARTRSAEAGLKFARADARAEFVLFRADTRDELTVNTSSGGRTTFQNAGDARRQGAELSADVPLAAGWRGQAALTYLDAQFRDDFLTCSGTPCRVADAPVPAGTRIPGVPHASAYAALRWGGDVGWQARFAGQYVGAVPVNNLDDERAPSYAVFGASAGYAFRDAQGEGRVFVAVDNLFDRRYAGSVIVNEGNRRYYEPAPDRHFTLGLEWRWRD